MNGKTLSGTIIIRYPRRKVKINSKIYEGAEPAKAERPDKEQRGQLNLSARSRLCVHNQPEAYKVDCRTASGRPCMNGKNPFGYYYYTLSAGKSQDKFKKSMKIKIYGMDIRPIKVRLVRGKRADKTAAKADCIVEISRVLLPFARKTDLPVAFCGRKAFGLTEHDFNEYKGMPVYTEAVDQFEQNCLLKTEEVERIEKDGKFLEVRFRSGGRKWLSRL